MVWWETLLISLRRDKRRHWEQNSFSPKIEERSSYLLHPLESVDYTLAPQKNSLAEKKHQHGDKTK